MLKETFLEVGRVESSQKSDLESKQAWPCEEYSSNDRLFQALIFYVFFFMKKKSQFARQLPGNCRQRHKYLAGSRNLKVNGSVKTVIPGPTSRVSYSVKSELGLSIYISDKFPDNAMLRPAFEKHCYGSSVLIPRCALESCDIESCDKFYKCSDLNLL